MSRVYGSGGVVVTRAMREILDKRGRIPVDSGGQLLRLLYMQNASTFDPTLLTKFARRCFLGDIEGVKRMMEDGKAPSMLDTETAFHYGYALLAIMGGQRVVATHDSVQPDHVAVLNLVLECGAPPDLPDILGYTPLHHVCMASERLDLLRTLLEHGANPNAQDRFGCVPITSACQRNYVDTIDVLMEFSASLDVEDADGCTPEEFYPKGGAYVTAVVQKWKRRRAGETVALNEEGCTTCGKVVPKLKYCASCHAARYCSKDCQRTHWPAHKTKCIPFSTETTVTVIPFYEDIGELRDTSNVMRSLYGFRVPKQPARHSRSMHWPQLHPGETKKMVVKIQVPFDPRIGEPTAAEIGDMIVFDKKRSLVCRLRRQDDPEAYLRISRTIRAKGVLGAKAYFSAVMMHKDELVIKVDEVLAEMAF